METNDNTIPENETAPIEQQNESTPVTESQTPQPQTNESMPTYMTPPAGIYPKMDSQGRVIRYKRRGGVFPFFMGLFTALFVLIFGVGVALSYFYYCVKVDDVADSFGVDTGFLPVETNDKTANEIIKALIEYKNGYTEITVSEVKSKFGFDLEEFIETNLDITITDLYDINLSIASVNDGIAKKLGDFRLQDILNNLSEFIDNLLPEIYKKIDVQTIMDKIGIDLTSFGYPILTDEMFNVTPNSETSTMKSFNQLNTYELINIVLPNYFNSDKLTIRFIQAALGLDLIPDTEEYSAILNSTIGNLNIDEVLDNTSIRSILELAGIDAIPLDDERYDALLNSSIGNININSLLQSVTVDAILDLMPSLEESLSEYEFLSTDEFKSKTIDEIPTYLKTLTISEIISTPEEIFLFDCFTIDNVTYYIKDDAIYQQDTATKNENGTFSLEYEPEHQAQYYLYDNYVYKYNTTKPISNNKASINGTLYNFDFVNNQVSTSASSNIYAIVDNKFRIGTNTLCSINTAKTQVTCYTKETKILGNRFVVGSINYKIDNNTTLSYLKKNCDINTTNSTFTINAISYIIDNTNNIVKSVDDETFTYHITPASSTIDIALNKLADLTIQNILDGDLDSIAVELESITVGELISDKLTGFLSCLNNISVGAIIENPSIIIDSLQDITLQEFANIQPEDAIIGKLYDVSFGDILGNSNIILDRIKTITFSEFGFDSTNTFLGELSTLTIGDIMADSTIILDTIRNKSLTNICGKSGIMNIIGSLTIGNLMDDPNSLTTTLQSSYASLYELLGQELYEYKHFTLYSSTYYIIKTDSETYVSPCSKYPITTNGTSKTFYLTNEPNSTSTVYTIHTNSSGIIDAITYEALGTQTIPVTNNQFSIGMTYNIFANNIISYMPPSLSYNVVNTNNKFQIYGHDPINGSFNGTYTLDLDNNVIKDENGDSVVATIYDKTDSLTTALMSITLNDLFSNNLSSNLSNTINTVQIADVLTTNGNFLLEAIVNKANAETPATIGNLNTLINQLNVGDLFSSSSTPTGIITLLSYTDTNTSTTYSGANIPLTHLADALNDFDITSFTICELYTNGLLPNLEDTIFDSNSTNYNSAVENITLIDIINAYINSFSS